jgi:chromosome segregation ATPase
MEIATRRREQEVWQACDDLWAVHGEVRDITGDAIRERLMNLGKSKGSPNEIYKYRKTWIKSRRLDSFGNNDLGSTEDDPITRAVKLVHEKLKSEANDRIAHLEEELANKLKQKEEELNKTKNALDQVMTEYNGLKKELGLLKQERKSFEEQLLAEIDIRKASEHELIMQKTLNAQIEKAHGLLVNEIKIFHEEQLKQLNIFANEKEKKAKDAFDKLIEEKKQLGHEYSEKLNELKVTIHNKDILLKQLEKEIIDYDNKIEELTSLLNTKENHLDLLTKENVKIQSTLCEHKTEIRLIKKAEQDKNLELKNLLIDLKKSQIMVARMRVCIAREKPVKYGYNEAQ